MIAVAKSQPEAVSPDAPRLVPDWRVHVGAHKTATEHFRVYLRQLEPNLRSSDGTVLLRETLRDPADAAALAHRHAEDVAVLRARYSELGAA
ncbi:MAG: hypothetical protein V2I65_07705 [Paracoccaceae bacterium]|jgi:hypothetical protein|nr:hypothetical protein [Paracoccaceae bacterium]